MAIEICDECLDEPTPLAVVGIGEGYDAEKAYIVFDPCGLGHLHTWNFCRSVSSYSVDVWNKLVVTWDVPVAVPGITLQAIFASEEFLNLCGRIQGGFAEVWDGWKMIGRYTDSAQRAINDAAILIEMIISKDMAKKDEKYLGRYWQLSRLWNAGKSARTERA